MKNFCHLLFMGAALCLLAGCGENESASAPEQETASPSTPESTPPPAEQTDPGQDDSTTDDAAREIREAAEATGQALREGAGRLLEQGRQALDDAGPALDRAEELAGQIGNSLGELAEQARRNFNQGVELLERRIAEETGGAVRQGGDPESALGPAEELEADTRAAAEASAAGIGPAYVGVWAGAPADCGRIDRDAVEQFAVITTSTVRRHEALCNFEPIEIADGAATLEARCIAEGSFEDRRITLEMPDADALTIGTADGPGRADLVRCHLPR